MFFIGFLLTGVVFVALVFVVNLAFPRGTPRIVFPLVVFGAVVGYPFLHYLRPSYAQFKELCARTAAPVIVQRRTVDFILLEAGFSSDCAKGPALIEDSGYLGFDCRRRIGVDTRGEARTELLRYTRKPGIGPQCGLECFVPEKISEPEAKYGMFARSRTRDGYLAGDERVVTLDYPGSKQEDIPFWRWLRFSDKVLVDETYGEMAFTTHYYYLPYGPITALGLASGSAPSEQCPRPPIVDPRTVYPSKQPTNR